MRRTTASLIALSLFTSAAPSLAGDKPLLGDDKPLLANDVPETKAPKAAAAEIKPTAPAEPADMVKLFNGKDLQGWDGDPKLWRFENGVVVGETTKENVTKGNTFLIWQGGELKDFELRLGFRITDGNSGVQYRAQRAKDAKSNPWVIKGYQAEVENTPGKVGFLYDEGGRGYLANVGERASFEAGEKKPTVTGKLGEKDAIGATYKKGDWNEYIIIAKGNVLSHYLNGVQTIEFTDNDDKSRELSGLLALQIHSGPPMVVEFKDVRLKQDGGK